MAPCEPIPAHTHELRYLSDGYVVIRWTIAPGEYVEVREHRLVTGALPGEHVHHKNHIKTDNRPENLVRLTPSVHEVHHGEERRIWDLSEMIQMYEAGQSTPEIARHFGCDPSNIYRALVRHGYQPRTLQESFTNEYRRQHGEITRQKQNDPIYRQRKSDGLKAAWARRTPEERAAIGRRISEAKLRARPAL